MLDILKILTLDKQDMSQEAIDFIVDKSIEKQLEKLLYSNEPNSIEKRLYYLHSKNQEFRLTGEALIFYASNAKAVKERVFHSFARYNTVVPKFMAVLPEGLLLSRVMFNYDFYITLELREKMRLEQEVVNLPESSNHFVLKI